MKIIEHLKTIDNKYILEKKVFVFIYVCVFVCVCVRYELKVKYGCLVYCLFDM